MLRDLVIISWRFSVALLAHALWLTYGFVWEREAFFDAMDSLAAARWMRTYVLKGYAL